MLRHLKDSQKGGIGTYTKNLLDQLVRIDKENQYCLIYKDQDLGGCYANQLNIEEIVIHSPTNLVWDQIVVPLVAKRKKLNLIFNPKLSIPLLGPGKKVFVLHGADWFVFPENYKLSDRAYHRVFAPLYCESADAIISVSQSATNDIVRYTAAKPEKIRTIYHGVNRKFKPIDNRICLDTVRGKYTLPDHFVLYVGQIYPMKNVGRIIRAFSILRKKTSHKLVIVGKPTTKYKKDLALVKELSLHNDVILTGWIPEEDLPAFYNLADLFVFPSLYEGFGIPLLEAMACGCPVVTSNRGAPQEVVADAAMLVNPLDVSDIATTMHEVLTNKCLEQNLREKGFKRVKHFTWEKCAEEVLTLFASLT